MLDGAEVTEAQFAVAEVPPREPCKESLCILRLRPESRISARSALPESNSVSESLGVGAGVSKVLHQNDCGRLGRSA